MWLPPSFTSRRNVSAPLIVRATILSNQLEAECTDVSAQLAQPNVNPRLDLDRLGLSPARKQEAVPDPRRSVVHGLAETTQPDWDRPFFGRGNIPALSIR
jgi:hypothetical protein